jgi:hypothetical protein
LPVKIAVSFSLSFSKCTFSNRTPPSGSITVTF